MSTILLVEDDPGNRMLLRVVLERDGHAIIEAANGEEALDIIKRSLLPDIVVTDLSMPVLNGIDLINRLQSEPATATMPIVVVSGNHDVAASLHASGLVEAVVKKPINVSTFAACIREVVNAPTRLREAT